MANTIEVWDLKAPLVKQTENLYSCHVFPPELCHVFTLMPCPPGGPASAGHVPALPAVVAPRVHPGVQGQLSGPERRLQPQHDGERLLRRGRRVLHRARRHSHRGTARRGSRRRDGIDGSGQEWKRRR